MGRWGISQSDGSDSRAKLSSKTKKRLFSDKQEGQKTLGGFCRVSAVPTFENGGPLLVPHLFELPSEVPRRERIQGQAGKAPQDGLVQSLRALRLTLSHVPHGSLLRRHVGRRRALCCSYHSSMWSLPPASPYFSTRVSECFSSLLQNNLPFKQEGQKNVFEKKKIILLCRDAARAVSLSLLMCFNPCTCQGSSASYSNIHELGRYWITWTAPPLFQQREKKKRERREGQSHEWVEEGGGGGEGGEGGGGGGSLDSHNISAHCMPTRHSWINILYLSWSRTHQCANRYVVPLALLMRSQKEIHS